MAGNAFHDHVQRMAQHARNLLPLTVGATQLTLVVTSPGRATADGGRRRSGDLRYPGSSSTQHTPSGVARFLLPRLDGSLGTSG